MKRISPDHGAVGVDTNLQLPLDIPEYKMVAQRVTKSFSIVKTVAEAVVNYVSGAHVDAYLRPQLNQAVNGVMNPILAYLR